jgi:hypothetical protein
MTGIPCRESSLVPTAARLTVMRTSEQLNQLVDRYISLWNDPDPAVRRKLIHEVWRPDGAEVLVDPPQEIREAAKNLEFPIPTLDVHGYDALEARVTRAYDMFIAPGEYVFRRQRGVRAARPRDRLQMGHGDGGRRGTGRWRGRHPRPRRGRSDPGDLPDHRAVTAPPPRRPAARVLPGLRRDPPPRFAVPTTPCSGCRAGSPRGRRRRRRHPDAAGSSRSARRSRPSVSGSLRAAASTFATGGATDRRAG